MPRKFPSLPCEKEYTIPSIESICTEVEAVEKARLDQERAERLPASLYIAAPKMEDYVPKVGPTPSEPVITAPKMEAYVPKQKPAPSKPDFSHFKF